MCALRKRYLALFIIFLIMLTSLTQSHVTYNQLELQLKGETHQLNYKPSGFYIDYYGDKYRIEASENAEFIDLSVADLDHDEIDEILALVGEKGASYANELVIYNLMVDDNDLMIKESYHNNMKVLRPWMIETCEIDNDGDQEIFIGVNKATHYYPEVENRPFFFNFKENMLVKKWTGSKLRSPFLDVCFSDINSNGSDEIIVIEEAEHGGFVIAVYYWFGFGFILQAESAVYDTITSVNIVKADEESEGTTINASVRKNNRTEWVTLVPSMDITENQIYLLKEKGE